ncbi:Alpha/Beta hydrolase protein [Cadophora sp. MPI-SDFR-AT-0126]|nr:Alpha/Beta hydrolase protein [Leotiomycetes sp. MPI-SDFR-AT-0126]
MSPDEQLLLGKPDPDFLKFLQQGPPPPGPPPLDIDLLRKQTQGMHSKSHPTAKGTTLQESLIHTRDGSAIQAFVVSPVHPPLSGSPVLLWFHGGGFCLGDGETEVEILQNIALHAGFIGVSVNYRLAPEHKFPAAVYDGQDALKWVVDNAVSLKANLTSGFVIGGTSAGGNLAAVLAHWARDTGLKPPLTGQYLAVPPLLPASEYEDKYRHRLLSSTQDMPVDFLNPDLIKLFDDSYGADAKSPLYNVFRNPAGFGGLPPAYIQVCGLDPLRDEDLLYEDLLAKEGQVKTRLDVYPGLPHQFWGFFPDFPGNVKQAEDTITGLKWLLEQV